MDENKKEFNPFDYVTIPVKEYKKLIQKTARKEIKKELEKKYSEEMAEVKRWSQNYHRWWQEEEAKRKALEKKLKDAGIEVDENDGDN